MTAITCLPAEYDIQLVTDEYSTCDLLASELTVANNTVSTVQLLSWNPTIIGPCDSLQVGQYVCITQVASNYLCCSSKEDVILIERETWDYIYNEKIKLISNQLDSSYTYFGINSDGSAWFLICTSLMLQQSLTRLLALQTH
jgi:hypothetical protein